MSSAPDTTRTGETAIRRPYRGSCHCGAIRYIAYIILPIEKAKLPAPGQPVPLPAQVVYRCNCTPCHKAGFFHIRLANAPDDFVLLSPLDPLVDLGDYTVNSHRLHWLFCKTCGVRCFILHGQGEIVELDVEGKGETVKAWRPKKEGWFEWARGDLRPPAKRSYLSVNAYTLEPGQEGLDLREWTEEKRVTYLDCLEFKGPSARGEPRRERPHLGGAY